MKLSRAQLRGAMNVVGWGVIIVILLGLVCIARGAASARTHVLAGMESGEYIVSVGPNDTGGHAIISWAAEPPGMVYLGTFPYSGSAQVGVALASAGHSQWNPLTQKADPSMYINFEPGEPVFTPFLGEGWYTIWVFGAEQGSRLYSKWRTG